MPGSVHDMDTFSFSAFHHIACMKPVVIKTENIKILARIQGVFRGMPGKPELSCALVSGHPASEQGDQERRFARK
jgi:hypothetical protein